MIHKHLCFVFETTERARMDDPVTVALVWQTAGGFTTIIFGQQAPT
jgi:hypothetical protein